MYSKLSILAVFLFKVINSQSQDISGYWQGVLYQTSGGPSTYYPYSMQLIQAQNGNITGVTYSKQPNSIYFVNHSLTGTFINNVFSFQTQIIAQLPQPGYYWCTPVGQLTYNSVSETLIGPWNAPTCFPGTIELWRLKIISDTLFCIGQTINLEVTGQNVKWYSDSSLSTLVSNGNTYVPNLNNTTTFYITQTHYNTESPAIPITVTIKPKSFFNLNQSICEGQSYLGHSTSGTFIDTFVAANGCDSIRTLNLTIKPKSFFNLNQSICEGQSYLGHSTSGTFIDTFVAANGCDSIRTLNLTIKPKSFFNLNQSICEGQSYLGHNTSGTFIDTFVAANGCDSIRTLNLTIKPKLFFNLNQSICEGQSYLGYSSSGTFIDTFAAANGCDSIRTLKLILLDKPNPNLGNNREICKGDSIILFPGQFLSYLWQDGATKNNMVVYKAGKYSVIVTNSCGSKKDEVLITQKNCDIYFPNAFTPNSDGRNDEFKILNGLNVKNYHLMIYNRWGQKLFETKDFSKGWNGKLKGIEQEPGAYVWFCEYIKDGIHKEQKGTVALIR